MVNKMFNKPEPPKEKVQYKEGLKCFLKKEMGEDTESCKEIRKKMNIEE